MFTADVYSVALVVPDDASGFRNESGRPTMRDRFVAEGPVVEGVT